MTVHIGALRPEDFARCAELERELFAGDDPWRESAFAAELAAGHHYRAARTADGVLVGYAGIALLARPPRAEAEVHTIAVDPRFQRDGVGRLLLRALLVKADQWRANTYLEVRTDNAAAIALYASEGFEVVGTRRRYYQPSGADAYTMVRSRGRPVDLDRSERRPDGRIAPAGRTRSRPQDPPDTLWPRTGDTP